jgi:hypothetical protein
MAEPNTILISPADGQQIVREKLAGGAITPGHLLERSSSTWVVHANAGKNSQRIFALENVANAEGIADAYASGESVRGLYAQSGMLVNALVAATATAITEGAALESDGDGTLRIATTDAATDDTQREAVVGYANEAVDNSTGTTVVRIEVEVA